MTQVTVKLLPVATATFCDPTILTDQVSFEPPTRDDAWDLVNDPIDTPDDAQTSIGFRSTERFSALFPALSTLGITASSIVRITPHFRALRQVAGSGTPIFGAFVYFGAQLSDDPALANINNTTYLNFTGTGWALNPVTGAAWDVADLEAQRIEFGVGRSGSSNRSVTCTQFYLEMVYNTTDWGRVGTAGGSWDAAAGAAGGWQMLSIPTSSWTRSS